MIVVVGNKLGGNIRIVNLSNFLTIEFIDTENTIEICYTGNTERLTYKTKEGYIESKRDITKVFASEQKVKMRETKKEDLK